MIQPMTRPDAATMRSSTSVSPSMATAAMIERLLSRSRPGGGPAAMAAYRTGVAPPPEEDPVEVDLDWRSVAMFLAAFVALAGLTGLARGATHTITWLIVGSLLALALDPLVARLKRRLGGHRGVAVAVVLGALLLAIALLAAVFGPPAVRQARALSRDLPSVVNDLGDLPIIGPRLRDANVADKVQQFLNDLPQRLGGDATPIEDAGRSILGGALAGIA